MFDRPGVFFVKVLALLTAALALPLGDTAFFVVICSTGLVHFFQGAYYGRAYLKETLQTARGKFVMFIFALIWMFFFFKMDSGWAFAFFLPHYAFSEAYFNTEQKDFGKLPFASGLRILFEGLVYFLISWREHFVLGREEFYFAVLAIIGLTYAVVLFYNKDKMSRFVLFNRLGTALLSLGFVILDYKVLKLWDLRGAFLLGFIHALTWLYSPLLKENFRINVRARAQFIIIVGSTALVIAGFYGLSRLQFLNPLHIYSAFILFLYFHALTSFASSKENPRFIFNFFHRQAG